MYTPNNILLSCHNPESEGEYSWAISKKVSTKINPLSYCLKRSEEFMDGCDFQKEDARECLEFLLDE